MSRDVSRGEDEVDEGIKEADEFSEGHWLRDARPGLEWGGKLALMASE